MNSVHQERRRNQRKISKWIIIWWCANLNVSYMLIMFEKNRKSYIHETLPLFLSCTNPLPPHIGREEPGWFCMRGHFSRIVINKDLHWHLRQAWLWGSSALYSEIGGILQYYQSCNFLQYHFTFVLFSCLFPALLFWPFLPCWSVIKSPDPVTSWF